MTDTSRKALFFVALAGMLAVVGTSIWFQVLTWDSFLATPALWLLLASVMWLLNELWNWTKVGKLGEMAGLSVLLLLGATFYLVTSDFFTALLGAFGVYLFIGMFELKEYPVINKLALITAIVYNVIFAMGLLDTFLPIEDFSYRDTAFGFSFWLILILGFAFFGRKYMIVWRFMSPQYLTLGLYLVAWLAVVYVARFLSIDFTTIIYEALIITNFIVYFISGPLLGVIMGIKRSSDPELESVVAEVAAQVGIKGNIKVGIGRYPIINAMAYGAFFDKRVGIICEDWRAIPRNELQGIIAHELAHLKGNHTFILAIITTLDLVVRKALQIPATMYDYTFNPGLSERFPLFYFILLNLVIFGILYIFVRLLEGKADRVVRDIGRGEDLAKALYNLEGFYASGREIGLNTMLLCEEKILPENREMDYLTTAEYISNYLTRPGRASLLSNFLNSHPPSPIRIASMYNRSFGPFSEALATFSLLGTEKRKKFSLEVGQARQLFEEQVTAQFLRMFGEESIPALCTRIGREDRYKFLVGQSLLLVHKITNAHLYGTLESVKWANNAGMPAIFSLREFSGNLVDVPAALYDATAVRVGGTYEIKKIGVAHLEAVVVAGDGQSARLRFRQKSGNTVDLDRKTVKLPLPFEFLRELVGKQVFLKKRGTLIPYTCTVVEGDSTFQDFCFHVRQQDQDRTEIWQGRDFAVFPRHVGFALHKDKDLLQDQFTLLKAVQEAGFRVNLNLKKPVNNEERGRILAVDAKETLSDSIIRIMNVFGKEKELPLKEVDFITFSEDTAMLESARDTSIVSRWLNKVVKRFRPASIFV